MKKVLLVILGSIVLLLGNSLFAINSNQSIEYVRTLNRNASTEVDASFFNPAGLVFLRENGLHVQVANQFLFQTKTVVEDSALINAYGENEYKGNIRSFVYPNIHVVYKKDKLAAFFNFIPISGGGGGDFKDGLPKFDNLLLSYVNQVIGQVASGIDGAYGAAVTNGYQYQLTRYSRDLHFEGIEYTLASTIGGAFKLNNMMSVALGYRLSYGYRHYSGYARDLSVSTQFANSAGGAAVDQALATNSELLIAQNWQDVEVDVESTGFGHSIQFGINVIPLKAMNIGFRFTYNYKQEIKNNSTTFKGVPELLDYLAEYKDGEKKKITEPPLFGLGISYMITSKFKVEASSTYSLDKTVDRTEDDTEDYYKNKMIVGIAFEYAILNELQASLGYLYDTGYMKDKARTEIEYGQPAHHISIGASYTINATLNVAVGFIYSLYQDASAYGELGALTNTKDQTVKRTGLDFGFGVNLKL